MAASRQRNGVFFGTPGGALPPLTPIEMARTPAPASTGTALRVRPGTSLCGPWSRVVAPAQLPSCACLSAAVTRWRRHHRLSSHLAGCELWRQAEACVQVVRELDGRREQRCVRGLSLKVEWQSVPGAQCCTCHACMRKQAPEHHVAAWHVRESAWPGQGAPVDIATAHSGLKRCNRCGVGAVQAQTRGAVQEQGHQPGLQQAPASAALLAGTGKQGGRLTCEAHMRHVAKLLPLLAADLSGGLNLQVSNCDIVRRMRKQWADSSPVLAALRRSPHLESAG